MTDLAALLAVQDHDTALAQLAYKMANLPERQSLTDVERRLVALEAAATEVAAQQAELQRRQRHLEDEAAALAARAGDAEKKLYSGTVTSPRELQALQADIASLKRHRSELDDAQLEVMIEREPVDAAAVEHEQRRRALDAEAAALRAAIAEAEVTIDREAAEHRAARADAAAGVASDILAVYDRVRAGHAAGVGAARLVNGTCMACRLKLPAVDLDRIKHQPAGTLVRCEECGAILVR